MAPNPLRSSLFRKALALAALGAGAGFLACAAVVAGLGRALGVFAALAAAALAALAAVVLRSAWRGAIEPLSRLEEAMRGFKQGGELAAIPAPRDAQLASLTTAFEAMIARIEGLTRLTYQVFDHSPMPIFFKDQDGRYVYANRSLEELLGAGPGGLVGRRISEFLPSGAGAEILAHDRKAAQTGRTILTEERLPLKSGVREFLSVKFPVVLESGGEPLVCGIATDVTELRREERERQRLAAVVEHSGLGVVITDPRGVVEYANAGFERMTGYRREEAVGRTPSLLKSGAHSAEFYARLWRTILGGRVAEERFTNRRKDGSLFVTQSTIAPVVGPSGLIENFIGVFRDVTKESRLEDELRQLQKMETVGQLAGGVAHDFNNILAVVLSGSELLAPAVASDPAAAADLEEIRKAGERGAVLVRQLLAFSRRQPLQRRPLDPRRILQEMRGMLERLLGESFEVAIDGGPSAGLVDADRGQIEQVILNLAANARDAMPRGGTLRLGVRDVEAARGEGGLSEGMAPGRYVVISVADGGSGIPPEVLPRIFEPFFTTKERGRGTGLGLSTVYGIVTQHGGRVRVESEVGVGSVFRVVLPRCADEGEPAGAASAAPRAGGTETILVVEDDDVLRGLIERQLSREGYRVVCARNADEALLRAEEGPAPALLLCDVVLKGAPGDSVSRRLRDGRPGLRVLFMSGCSAAELAARGLALGDARFVSKPFSREGLLAAVRKTLDS